MRCWGIGTSVGMEAQVKALAAALNLYVEFKRVVIRAPFVWLPNACFPKMLDKYVVPYALSSKGDGLSPPWPDVVISCGRRGAMAALGLKAHITAHGGYLPRFVHIQDPHVSASNFDVVVAMEHDRINGDNVIKTHFALHAVTPAMIADAAQRLSPQFAAYAAPKVAVLLGGSTNKYRFTAAAMQQVIAELQAWLDSNAGSLLITPSRRTGEGNIEVLKKAFAGNSRVYIYDGAGDNPYAGLLALADAMVVSNDSVNMMSEACATGKPIYILPLVGHEGTKPARFAERLQQEKIARLFGGALESWTYHNGNEMERIGAEIRKRLAIP